MVCLIFVLMAVNLSVGDPLGDVGRGAVGILAFVIYMVACAMRLRDMLEVVANVKIPKKCKVMKEGTRRDMICVKRLRIDRKSVV